MQITLTISDWLHTFLWLIYLIYIVWIYKMIIEWFCYSVSNEDDVCISVSMLILCCCKKTTIATWLRLRHEITGKMPAFSKCCEVWYCTLLMVMMSFEGYRLLHVPDVSSPSLHFSPLWLLPATRSQCVFNCGAPEPLHPHHTYTHTHQLHLPKWWMTAPGEKGPLQ